ncbi:MAG: helix-turn-helix domain-containing protein, partial [Bacillota bacterium]|nr:helix-turn-helix domain-containing protein [Bacillota bacterium]
MSITVKEIAEIAGVSRGTVDRALKNRSGISPETKKKILKIAEKYDYHPNVIGTALAKSGKT